MSLYNSESGKADIRNIGVGGQHAGRLVALRGLVRVLTCLNEKKISYKAWNKKTRIKMIEALSVDKTEGKQCAGESFIRA